MVWQVINEQFCSYKVKAATTTFCRNENNVTGLCNRHSCPLANSQYATVRELDGQLYLLKKTVERAHSPKNMWERILLPETKAEATLLIQQELEYWSPFLRDKCVLRAERLLEVNRKVQRLVAKADQQPILSTKASKVERRERSREMRAKTVAKLEMTIEKELMERLKQGVYGDMYNLNQKAFETVLDAHGERVELVEEAEGELDEEEYEFVEGEEEDFEDFSEVEEYEMEMEDEVEADDAESNKLVDIEDLQPKKRVKKGPFVEIEYETEQEKTTTETMN
mgnify:CR=1 FL=1